jgi:hypothetical protein
MKKVLALFAVVVLAVAFFGTTACKKPALVDPTPTATQFVLLDDFFDGDNRTDPGVFGGYWYSFDDHAAQFAPSGVDMNCGDSTVWPISDSVAQLTPNCTPTFIMSVYSAAPIETPPLGVTSPNYLRVYGNVDRLNTSGYKYGFIGFGANLLDAAADGSKNTINATALGYKRIQFYFKNGPNAGAGAQKWKVKLSTSVAVGDGSCAMQDPDNAPVCPFTATNTWQKFDKSLTADFAPETTWGLTACGSRAVKTNCATLVNAVSWYDGGAQYKCTSAMALTALNAIQWQTDFGGTSNTNAFDLELAQIVLIK